MLNIINVSLIIFCLGIVKQYDFVLFLLTIVPNVFIRYINALFAILTSMDKLIKLILVHKALKDKITLNSMDCSTHAQRH